MNCLQTFLKCSQFLTDPTEEDEHIDELTERIAQKCENYVQRKQNGGKRRFEHIDRYMRSEIFMLDEPMPSPNTEHILQITIDQVLANF